MAGKLGKVWVRHPPIAGGEVRKMAKRSAKLTECRNSAERFKAAFFTIVRIASLLSRLLSHPVDGTLPYGAFAITGWKSGACERTRRIKRIGSENPRALNQFCRFCREREATERERETSFRLSLSDLTSVPMKWTPRCFYFHSRSRKQR